MHPSRLMPILGAIALVGSLVASPASALALRFGGCFAEGPGGWLQFRQDLRGTELGGHLALSATPVDVSVSGSAISGNFFVLPSEHDKWANFYEFGLVVNRPMIRPGQWVLGISTGVLGGYLDKVRYGKGMLLLPAFAEVDWHPILSKPHFGLTLASGMVYTIPVGDDDLHRPLSNYRWQARLGLIF